MTHQHSGIHKPDAPFLASANMINDQCRLHHEWLIDPERLTALDGLVGNANTAFAVNNDRATHSFVTSANKKYAFAELKHFLGPFVDYLEVNENVPDTALEYMGLRPRTHHAHQPLPPPQKAPVVTVKKLHDEIIVYVAQPEQDHPTGSLAPVEYHAFRLRWKFEGEAQYRFEVSTRLHHTLYFEQTDETKRVLLSAAWVNPRLQPGPFSEEISVVIG